MNCTYKYSNQTVGKQSMNATMQKKILSRLSNFKEKWMPLKLFELLEQIKMGNFL